MKVTRLAMVTGAGVLFLLAGVTLASSTCGVEEGLAAVPHGPGRAWRAAADDSGGGRAISLRRGRLRGSTVDLRGAFRELECLIWWRRTESRLEHPVDARLIARYRALYRALLRRGHDLAVASRWRSFYTLGTHLYGIRNRWAAKARIPVYEVNGHHMVVPYWLEEARRRNLGTLLHFDSHADMQSLPEPAKLQRAMKELGRGWALAANRKVVTSLVNRCGMPVSAGVMAGIFRRVVWARPSWSEKLEFVNQRFLFGVRRWRTRRGRASAPPVRKEISKQSFYRLFYDPAMNPEGRLGWGDILGTMVQRRHRPLRAKLDLVRPFRFSVLTTDRAVGGPGPEHDPPVLGMLLQAVPAGSFTLDVDLDYFATIDAASGFTRSPTMRPRFSDIRTWKRQRGKLNARLAVFETLLLALKHKGRIPSLVTISDSTHAPFAIDGAGQGQSEYTPIEHAAFLREELHRLLRKVYGKAVEGRRAAP